jgi:hypothetical protein
MIQRRYTKLDHSSHISSFTMVFKYKVSYRNYNWQKIVSVMFKNSNNVYCFEQANQSGIYKVSQFDVYIYKPKWRMNYIIQLEIINCKKKHNTQSMTLYFTYFFSFFEWSIMNNNNNNKKEEDSISIKKKKN